MLRQWILAVTSMAAALHLANAQQSTRDSGFLNKKLLIAAALSGDTAKADAAIKAHFESLGMTVTMAPDVNPPSAEGYDLIFLSSDVKAKSVTDAYRITTVPIFTEKPWLLDFLGMTGYQPQKDYGEDEKKEQSFLWLVNAPNPIQVGFKNGMFMPVKHAIKMYNWGRPLPAAQVIAILPEEPEKGFIFAYEKGAYGDHDFIIPARRIFIGLTPEEFELLTPDGLKLFDSCALWALGAK